MAPSTEKQGTRNSYRAPWSVHSSSRQIVIEVFGPHWYIDEPEIFVSTLEVVSLKLLADWFVDAVFLFFLALQDWVENCERFSET